MRQVNDIVCLVMASEEWANLFMKDLRHWQEQFKKNIQNRRTSRTTRRIII